MGRKVTGARTNAIKVAITAGAVAIALSACGGNVTGPAEPASDAGSSDALDFVLCPDRMPREGSACTDEGNECLYWGPRSCQAAFSCTGGVWSTRVCPR